MSLTVGRGVEHLVTPGRNAHEGGGEKIGGVHDALTVHEQGTPLRFSFDEMLRFSGPGSPAGVALGFKLLERAFALVGDGAPIERREVTVETAFRGPGVRDACEVVTRALTDGRYHVDRSLERPDRGHTLETFAFRVSYRGRTAPLVVREGFISDEFVRLAQASDLTDEDRRRFVSLKEALAGRLMSTPADAVFDAG